MKKFPKGLKKGLKKGSGRYEELENDDVPNGKSSPSHHTFTIDEDDEESGAAGDVESSHLGMAGESDSGPSATGELDDIGFSPSSDPVPRRRLPMSLLTIFSAAFIVGTICATVVILPFFLKPPPTLSAVTYSSDPRYMKWFQSWSSNRKFYMTSKHTVVQHNQANCGIATSSSLINYLLMAEPGLKPASLLSASASGNASESLLEASYSPYEYTSQDSIRNDPCFKMYIPSQPDSVRLPPYGTTLDQIHLALKCVYGEVAGVRVSKVVGGDGVRKFMEGLRLACGKRCVIALNFYRTSIGQEGGGHWSPIVVGFDGFSAISDVAKYKGE